MNAIDYTNQLSALLPPGAALPTGEDADTTKLMRAWADEFARIDHRAEDLLLEANPRTTDEMLIEWEATAGLPDPCSGDATTIQERKAQILAKITGIGGQTISFYKDLAEALGYPGIEIREYRPFVCGHSRCGDALNGGHDIRHTWKVIVPNPHVVLFRTGISQCGDKLGAIRRANGLECLFRRLAQSHTTLIFDYSGA